MRILQITTQVEKSEYADYYTSKSVTTIRVRFRLLTAPFPPLSVTKQVLEYSYSHYCSTPIHRDVAVGATHWDAAVGATHRDAAVGATHWDAAVEATHRDAAVGAPGYRSWIIESQPM